MPVGALPAGRYKCLPCSSSDVWPPHQFIPWLVSCHQCQMVWLELVQDGQGWVGLLSGTGSLSPSTPSTNQSSIDLVVSLMRVSTTASGLSTILVGLREFLGETPINPQYPPPLPLVYLELSTTKHCCTDLVKVYYTFQLWYGRQWWSSLVSIHLKDSYDIHCDLGARVSGGGYLSRIFKSCNFASERFKSPLSDSTNGNAWRNHMYLPW